MGTSVKELIEIADGVVPRITPQQAQQMLSQGEVLVVDVRDMVEVMRDGKVVGALHVSRGMLEFRADPACPYHFQQFRKDLSIILYCASGGRSALCGKTLKDLGYEQVFNLGAFKDWLEAGGAVEKVTG